MNSPLSVKSVADFDAIDDRTLLARSAVEGAHPHAAEPERRGGQALRAEGRLLHGGMNVQEMREYAAAYRAGANDAERLALLERHHTTVLARQEELHRHLAALEWKIAAY